MTPSPADDPERHCPRCGAGLAPRQEWCLECGYAATTRLVRAPSWKLPVAIVLGVLALAGAGVALAVGALSDDARDAVSSKARTSAQRAAATTPASATPTTPSPSASSATTSTPTTGVRTATDAAPAAGSKTRAIATWPSGAQGFTVVVLTASDRGAATARARQLVGAGTQAGVLRSADYRSLASGFFLVFSGRYSSKGAAQSAQTKLAAAGTNGYVAPVKR